MLHFRIFSIIAVFTSLSTAPHLVAKTIMINPAGHAKSTGCMLIKNYERAETLQCAETLKRNLEAQHAKVMLTRAPGEEIVPLQNASFANRVGVDLFVDLHFVKADGNTPTITFYYLTFDPVLDNAQRSGDKHSFVPINQAHFRNIDQTKKVAFDCNREIKRSLSGSAWQVYKKPLALPLKPLIGIQPPAILIECGLLHDQQWQEVTPFLTEILLR